MRNNDRRIQFQERKEGDILDEYTEYHYRTYDSRSDDRLMEPEPVGHVSPSPSPEKGTGEMYIAGNVLQGSRGRYELLAELGRGRTAIVFKARVMDTDPEELVVVKAMRPNLPSDEQERFFAEAYTLALLQGKSSIPPTYREMKDDAQPPFIVQELMTGEQLPDILARQGYLDEPTALKIGWQFCELLNILHNDLGMTYTDLKLENLWWNAEKETLRVTDWNVLGKDLSRVPNDLWRISRYLYRMLVGGPLELENGMRGPLDRYPLWHELSYGTQRILVQALRRDSKYRYVNPKTGQVDAEEMRKALWGQWRRWSQNGEDLLREAERLTTGEYNRYKWEVAKELTDMAERRLPVDETRLATLRDKVERDLGQEKSMVIRGQELARGGSYPAALEQFKLALDEEPWDVVAWRWQQLAFAGEAGGGFEAVREKAIAAVRAMDEGRWAQAERELIALELPTLEGLIAEARTRRLVAEGEKAESQGDFSAARQRYLEAEEALKGVPDIAHGAEDSEAENKVTYRACVVYDVGDLALRATEMQTLVSGVQEVARVIRLLEETEAKWSGHYDDSPAYRADWNTALRELEKGCAAVSGIALQDTASIKEIRRMYEERHQREAVHETRPEGIRKDPINLLINR